MPKQKLTDAVKNPEGKTETDEKPNGDNTSSEKPGAENGDGGNEGDAESSSESDDGDPADTDESDADPGSDAGDSSEPAAEKTLADFRSAFGHEQGSVFFADQTSFVDACVSHMSTQAKTIESQGKEIETLKSQNVELGNKIHGEEEAVDTAADGGGAGKDDDAVGAYAAGLKLGDK